MIRQYKEFKPNPNRSLFEKLPQEQVKIEKWARENKKIVIISSSIVLVLCAANFLKPSNALAKDIKTESTKIFSTKENEDNLSSTSKEYSANRNLNSTFPTSGLYYVNEEDIVLDKDGNPTKIWIDKDTKENVSFLSIGDFILEEFYQKQEFHQMLDEYVSKTFSKKDDTLSTEVQTEEEKYIQNYSEIYGLDYEKVYHILSSVTDQFQNEAYLNDYKIGDSMLKKRSVECSSKEMALLIAIRNLYYDKGRYGSFYDEIDTDQEYISPFDYAHQIKETSEILGIDPVLNYAICKSMTNDFENEIFLENHNPGGLIFDGIYANFPNDTVGFIEQSLEILKYKIDGRTTIEEIGERYVPDLKANPVWVSKVTSNYHETLEEYDDLFKDVKIEEKKEDDADSIVEVNEDLEINRLEPNFENDFLDDSISNSIHDQFEDLTVKQDIEFQPILFHDDIKEISLENGVLSWIDPIEKSLEENDDCEDYNFVSPIQEAEVLVASNDAEAGSYPLEEEDTEVELQFSNEDVNELVEEENIPVATPSDLEVTYIVDNPTKDMVNELYETYMEERRIELEEQARREAEEERIRLEEERVQEEKIYIHFYCEIYGLNYDQVYSILSSITDDFKDEEYLNNYVIGDSMLKKRYVSCNNKEMAFLIAIRNIYYTPDGYGYSSNDLNTGIEYISELDYSHQIAYFCNVVGIDPALSYAICCSESSFNSPMFLSKNNPAGIKFDSGFATFPSKTAGFIEQSLILLKYKLDGLTTIESIGYRYAPVDDPANSTWIPNVTNNYAKALANYDELFGMEGLEIIEVADAKVYTMNR